MSPRTAGHPGPGRATGRRDAGFGVRRAWPRRARDRTTPSEARAPRLGSRPSGLPLTGSPRIPPIVGDLLAAGAATGAFALWTLALHLLAR